MHNVCLSCKVEVMHPVITGVSYVNKHAMFGQIIKDATASYFNLPSPGQCQVGTGYCRCFMYAMIMSVEFHAHSLCDKDQCDRTDCCRVSGKMICIRIGNWILPSCVIVRLCMMTPTLVESSIGVSNVSSETPDVHVWPSQGYNREATTQTGASLTICSKVYKSKSMWNF